MDWFCTLTCWIGSACCCNWGVDIWIWGCGCTVIACCCICGWAGLAIDICWIFWAGWPLTVICCGCNWIVCGWPFKVCDGTTLLNRVTGCDCCVAA